LLASDFVKTKNSCSVYSIKIKTKQVYRIEEFDEV